MPVRGRTVALSLTLAAVLLGAVDAHAQTAATGGFSSCPPAGCSALPPVEVPLAGAAIAPDNRTAGAPAGAPPEVVKAVAAANRIARKPYKWGGGHGRWRDAGYDCSGTVSYVLHAAGLLDAARDSSGLRTRR